MRYIESLLGVVRDAIADKFGDAAVERLSEFKWLGLPIGAFAGLALLIGIHAASYTAFEDRENRELILQALERQGYRDPVVQHLWIGGLCLQAGHPYRWHAGRVRGTACVGDIRGTVIRGGSWWWPFGAPEPPSRQ